MLNRRYQILTAQRDALINRLNEFKYYDIGNNGAHWANYCKVRGEMQEQLGRLEELIKKTSRKL